MSQRLPVIETTGKSSWGDLLMALATIGSLTSVGRTLRSIALATLAIHSDRAAAREVDWQAFLDRQAPVWQRLPTVWEESPFLGNGWMGTMVYQNGENRRQLRVDVHHAGVTDHRDGSGMFETARLPIGHFLIETTGDLQACDLRLDLWNAELVGTVRTSAGQIGLRAMVPSQRDLIALEATPDAGERGLRISFHPAEAKSPRLAVPRQRYKDYPENPPSELLSRDGVTICQQPLLAGGGHATAWRVVGEERRTLFASVAHSHPEMAADGAAYEEVVAASRQGYDGLLPEHRLWWNAFYPTSFVSIPDRFWESFYWIQMYKLGASTRADGCLIDNHGPWLQPTPWPYATWNLNVQLTYWPFNASGHLREAESLPRRLWEHRDQLRKNVVPERFRHDSYAIGRAATETLNSPLLISSHQHNEIGNLPWALHNVWLQYRHTMDDGFLRERLFPLLKGSINYYLHVLEEGDDGRLHLPVTHSPEYGDAADANYDLSLLRWGCRTLLWIDERLQLNDDRAERWREVLDRLTDYPGDDEQGYYIGRDAKYAKSHRHYSHLLMIYPLYLVNTDQPGARKQIEKSVSHWHSLPRHLLGYSFTGSASIFASLGDGDRALAKLNGLRSFLLANTMYREGGPVIETPLSAAQSIHDLLVQSWGETIRVFPAVPSAWKDVVIDRLRTEGAFELSAKRAGGKTLWVRLKSLAGEPFRVRLGIEGPIVVEAGDGRVEPVEGDLYRLKLQAGEEAFFRRADFHGEPLIAPIEYPGASEAVPFGLSEDAKKPAE